MKNVHKDYEMLNNELQFSLRQVESGQAALKNEQLDEKVRTRVTAAVKYWESRCNILEKELEQDV
jgi:hypothetical protein